MKKTLLTCNVILYAFMYGIASLYVGFMFGYVFKLNNHMPPLDNCIIVHLLFLPVLIIAIQLARKPDYYGEIACCIMALITTAASAIYWNMQYVNHIKVYKAYVPEKVSEDFFLVVAWNPAVLFIIAVIISALYIACAVLSRIELQRNVQRRKEKQAENYLQKRDVV